MQKGLRPRIADAANALLATLRLGKRPAADKYERVASDEELACGSTAVYRDDLGEAPTEALLGSAAVPHRLQGGHACGRASCCMVIAFVALACAAYAVYKVMTWGFAPEATGLENVPVFGTSLGCLDAPHLYKSSEVVTFASPLGADADHALDIRGGAVGTITLDAGAADATEVIYELRVRASDANLLDSFAVRYPKFDVNDTRVLITTPQLTNPGAVCMRFDLMVRIPPNLRKLHVASHSTSHVQFSPEDTRLESLFVTLFGDDPRNMIWPSEALQADAISLEVYRGWIVGDIAVVDKASLKTQRGDGIMRISAHPVPRSGAPVFFSTTTGAGRTDVTWLANRRASAHRPIRGTHVSSRGGDVRLDYRGCFEGPIQLDSNMYSAGGLRAIVEPQVEVGRGESGMPSDPRWTHYAGERDGGDLLYVQSGGWTGLYI
ncbi:hypothetical protein HDZ31DRAFT_63873 [Schizophyllum fasciatum]